MKIAIFTETYLPTVNGVVNSIELFRHELQSRGHTVFVIAPHSDSESFKTRPHVFRLPALPYVGQPTHPVAIPDRGHVKAILTEIKPDIVHVQGMFSASWLGKSAAGTLNIPRILTYHTFLEGYAHYAGPLKFLVQPLLRWWTRAFARGFDVVITPSPSMAKILKSYHVTGDVVALATGIELKDYQHMEKRQFRSKLGLDPDVLYILNVGRLAEEKNVKQLLIDFGRVSVRDPRVHLLLAGDGPERQAYQEIIIARGLASQVTFLGVLKHSTLLEYFVAADIFAFPSLTDTQGIVLIEAMASATPCVVYDKLGPSDIVKHGESGLIAKPGTDQFFQHLMKMVEDQTLRERLAIGALREVRKYSIEKTTDQLEQLYITVAGHTNQHEG